jgi:hypothetical protein
MSTVTDSLNFGRGFQYRKGETMSNGSILKKDRGLAGSVYVSDDSKERRVRCHSGSGNPQMRSPPPLVSVIRSVGLDEILHKLGRSDAIVRVGADSTTHVFDSYGDNSLRTSP